MAISSEAFEKLSKYVHEICGIVVEERKSYLFEQRLSPMLKQMECEDYLELYEKLKSGGVAKAREKVIDAMTTNETSFFRDGHPFEVFRSEVLPWLESKIEERKQRSYVRKGEKVSIWSAASSTGQESFSLAMCIHEYCSKSSKVQLEDFLIKATDISREILAKAMTGRYSELEVKRGLDAQQLGRYFSKEGKDYLLNEDLLNLVDFRHMNLTQDFAALGGADVIFCRNVLIYFDEDTKRKILEGMFNLLSPGGYLFLGAMENMLGLSDKFEVVHVGKSTMFRRP